MKKDILWMAIVAILFTVGGAMLGMKRWETSPPQKDAAAILFSHSFPDLNQENQPMSKWKGKHLLVNFWATWCAPCVQEMPELSELQLEQKDKNLQIIGIGIDSADKMREFAGKYQIHYPLYVAGMSGVELTRQMGNQQGGLPFSVLISPNGQVQKTYIGRLDMAILRKDLTALR